MSDPKLIRLIDKARRDFAKSVLDRVPDGWLVTFREPTRTLEQNAKLWAMLEDISKAQPQGITATPDDWKAMAMNACGWECQFVLGLDGRPFPVGFRSSHLTVRQMADLITFLSEYGDRHGVQWSEHARDARESA